MFGDGIGASPHHGHRCLWRPSRWRWSLVGSGESGGGDGASVAGMGAGGGIWAVARGVRWRGAKQGFWDGVVLEGAEVVDAGRSGGGAGGCGGDRCGWGWHQIGDERKSAAQETCIVIFYLIYGGVHLKTDLGLKCNGDGL